jgi:hypothetical protein
MFAVKIAKAQEKHEKVTRSHIGLLAFREGDRMSCKICGRNNCTQSFHTCEEQTEFDISEEKTISRIKNQLIKQIQRLKDCVEQDNKQYINYEDVEKIISEL